MEELQSNLIKEDQPSVPNQPATNNHEVKKLCENCNSKKALYRCPRCLFQSCSVGCVKAHKTEKNCSGDRDLENGAPEDVLLNDYCFLEDIKSKLESSLRNTQNHFLHNHKIITMKPMKSPAEQNPSADYTNNLAPQLKHKGGLDIPNYPTSIPSLGVLLHRRDVPVILKRLRQKIHKRGTKILFMSRNMSRRKFNRTYHSYEDKSIKWHVVLRFIHANVVFEKIADENLTIADIISEYLEENPEELQGEYLEKSKDDEESFSQSDSSSDEEVPIDSDMNDNEVVKGYTSSFNDFCVPKKKPLKMKDVKPLVVDITPQYREHSPQALDEEQTREMNLYQSAGLGGIAVVLLNEDFEDNRKYVRFDLEDTLRENLHNMRIVENPILVVMRESHVYEFMREETLKEEAKEKTVEQKEKKRENSLKYFDASTDDDE